MPAVLRTFSEWGYGTLFSFDCLGGFMTQERKDRPEPQGYVAYLLRLWVEKGSEVIRWRASLQDPHSDKRLGFAHVEDLFDFLRRETEKEDDGSENGNGPGCDGKEA
jgi:hypothetical protein